MRISRPCYDKPHRCPGWAGGGWMSGDDSHPCQSGSIRTRKPDPEYDGEFVYPSSAKWRPGYCVGSRHTSAPPCGVVTVPWALRWLDPRWYRIYVWTCRAWLRRRRS